MRWYFFSRSPILVSDRLTLKKSYTGSDDRTYVEENRLGDNELEEVIELLFAVEDEVLLQVSRVSSR